MFENELDPNFEKIFQSNNSGTVYILEQQALKGQLVSECLFDFFKFSKKKTKNLTNFCPRI